MSLARELAELLDDEDLILGLGHRSNNRGSTDLAGGPVHASPADPAANGSSADRASASASGLVRSARTVHDAAVHKLRRDVGEPGFPPPTTRKTASTTPLVRAAVAHAGSGDSTAVVGEPMCRMFPFETFNALQSACLPRVFHSDDNLVIQAPTGAGKTTIMELAVLRCVSRARARGSGRGPLMVYLAPTKSLAQERCRDWTARFAVCQVTCRLLTGDDETSVSADVASVLQQADVLITTPEKWDSVTRRWREEQHRLRDLSLVLIDEVHLLRDPQRGPTLEAVVSRVRSIRAAGSDAVRFIAMSATIPNAEDIAAWLHASHGLLTFGPEYRPVPLDVHVLGYPRNKNAFLFDRGLTYKLADVIDRFCDAKPALVFCSSRQGCSQTASHMTKTSLGMLQHHHQNLRLQHQHHLPLRYDEGRGGGGDGGGDASYYVQPGTSDDVTAILTRSAAMLRDRVLREVVPHGVAFHHAGLCAEDRRIVEQLFRQSALLVLCTTSTLAQGVNLPAHLVVVKGTHMYRGGVGYQAYDTLSLQQMIGRAGRQGFDTAGVAVIMTDESDAAEYEAMTSRGMVIESSMHLRMIEHLNAEITLGTISDVAQAVAWLQTTFFYVRVTRCPQHYGLPAEEAATAGKVAVYLRRTVLEHLTLLTKHGMIQMHEDGFQLAPLAPGRSLARFYIAFASVAQLKPLTADAGSSTGLADLLSVLSKAAEFAGIALRRSEKRELNRLNGLAAAVRFRIKGRIKSTADKVSVLLQSALSGIAPEDWGLKADTVFILTHAGRVVRCFADVFRAQAHFTNAWNAMVLSTCLSARMWEDSEFVVRQLPGIGVEKAKALVSAGITSFPALVTADPRRLESLLSRNPPFGTQLRQQAAAVLRARLDVSARYRAGDASNTSGLILVVRVVIEPIDAAVAAGAQACRSSSSSPSPRSSWYTLLIGTRARRLLRSARFRASTTTMQTETANVAIPSVNAGSAILCVLVHEALVGLDVVTEVVPRDLASTLIPSGSLGSTPALQVPDGVDGGDDTAVGDDDNGYDDCYPELSVADLKHIDSLVRRASSVQAPREFKQESTHTARRRDAAALPVAQPHPSITDYMVPRPPVWMADDIERREEAGLPTPLTVSSSQHVPEIEHCAQASRWRDVPGTPAQVVGSTQVRRRRDRGVKRQAPASPMEGLPDRQGGGSFVQQALRITRQRVGQIQCPPLRRIDRATRR